MARNYIRLPGSVEEYREGGKLYIYMRVYGIKKRNLPGLKGGIYPYFKSLIYY